MNLHLFVYYNTLMIQMMFVCCLQICTHLLMLFGNLPCNSRLEGVYPDTAGE